MTEKVERFFNEYAYAFDAIYGTKQTFLNRLLNPVLRKSMRVRFEKSIDGCDPKEHRTVLDIGCGPGHYSIALAQKGIERIVGIDFAEEMIRISRERASAFGFDDRCVFLVEDIFDYRPQEKFDYSIVMGVMDYIEVPERMIERVIELTREKAFFSFPASGGILAVQRKIRYRKRCPLFLYGRKRLVDLFEKYKPHTYEIERIHRDFFVTLTIGRDL